jgi:hypothetical protein
MSCALNRNDEKNVQRLPSSRLWWARGGDYQQYYASGKIGIMKSIPSELSFLQLDGLAPINVEFLNSSKHAHGARVMRGLRV